jgi:hypothetical protein
MTRGSHGVCTASRSSRGVYRLDEGALLDDFFHFLHELGMVDWLNDVQGTAVQRVMVPCVQYVLLYGLKTLDGVESMNALPALVVYLQPAGHSHRPPIR